MVLAPKPAASLLLQRTGLRILHLACRVPLVNDGTVIFPRDASSASGPSLVFSCRLGNPTWLPYPCPQSELYARRQRNIVVNASPAIHTIALCMGFERPSSRLLRACRQPSLLHATDHEPPLPGSEDMLIGLMWASTALQQNCFETETELNLEFRSGSAH